MDHLSEKRDVTMAEEMTPYERIENAWNLEEADRVPVAPLVIYILPYVDGLSFKDIFSDPENLVQAVIDNIDLVGDNITQREGVSS